MNKLAEYYAAALVHIARENENGISQRREKIGEILETYLNIPISEEEIGDALRILNRCDISYVEEDEFAGTFVVVTGERFDGFLERVAKERDEYDNIIRAAPDEHVGISRAEDAYLPHLTAYGTYTVLRKYSAFGADWLDSAIAEIRRRSQADELDRPASDKVIQLDQNDPDLAKIKVAADELRAQLISGNDLGGLSPEQAKAAANEVEQLQASLSKDFVRPTEIAQRAKRTLKWVGEKAANTFVGQAATALFKLLMNFLGIPL